MTISPITSIKENDQTHDLVLKTFRCYIADIVQNFNGGHPGSAMGMAAIGVALYKYQMLYNPKNYNWFNRDRFVLSNGHVCLWQYLFQHLVGYPHMTVEQLKMYHADKPSYSPGHPEIENPAIEVTTGPLGQGIANAVGLAMASKNLSAIYNKPGYEVVNNTIYCTIGDACLQEGVALEAISLAGHLRLDNLIVIYDDNNVTVDGSADLYNDEDVNGKFAASNFNVIDVWEGDNNIEEILNALVEAKSSTDKPTFIHARTTIAKDSAIQGTCAAHSSPIGANNIEDLKKLYGFDPKKKFYIPDQVTEFFKDLTPRGADLESNWNLLVENYVKEYPDLGKEFQRRISGKLPDNWESLLPKPNSSPISSRMAFSEATRGLCENITSFVAGSADLEASIKLRWESAVDFQSPKLRSACGINGDYSGRYIRYGIREHAMAAIANGFAAYNKGTFIPISHTFLMFWLYASPAVRMSALQNLKVICVGSHDSIGLGEDGPTHQPIAVPALFRSIPNCYFFRPADRAEVAGLLEFYINAEDVGPSLFSLSRQNLPQYTGKTSREGAKKGGYVIEDVSNADLQLIGTGSDLSFCVDLAKELTKKGLKVRIVSFPCQRLFDQQDEEYQKSVLKKGELPSVVIETYSPNGWEKYATAGYNMNGFGKSLPSEVNYKYFHFSIPEITAKVYDYYKYYSENDDAKYYFKDLNLKSAIHD